MAPDFCTILTKTDFFSLVKDNIIDVLETVINNACAKLKTKYEPSSVDKFAKEALQAYQSSIERHIPALTVRHITEVSVKLTAVLGVDFCQTTEVVTEEASQLLQEVARKYFSINPSVLLPEDEIQQTQYSEEEEKQLIEELATARKEYIAVRDKNYCHLIARPIPQSNHSVLVM